MKKSKMAGNLRLPNGRNWLPNHVPLQPNPSSHQSSGCTVMWGNEFLRSQLPKSALGSLARIVVKAWSNRIDASVPHAWGITSLT